MFTVINFEDEGGGIHAAAHCEVAQIRLDFENNHARMDVKVWHDADKMKPPMSVALRIGDPEFSLYFDEVQLAKANQSPLSQAETYAQALTQFGGPGIEEPPPIDGGGGDQDEQ